MQPQEDEAHFVSLVEEALEASEQGRQAGSGRRGTCGFEGGGKGLAHLQILSALTRLSNIPRSDTSGFKVSSTC